MVFYDCLPKLDLHGVDRSIATVLINEFIMDNYKIGSNYVIIVHGKGSGILRKTTHEVLRTNKLVSNYKLNNFNLGCTVVKLKEVGE